MILLSVNQRQPKTVQDWVELAKRKADLAELTLRTSGQRASCYEACGFAIEAYFKAALLIAHQKQRWDAEMDGLYRHHHLRRLGEALGATHDALIGDARHREAFSVVYQWRRSSGYNPDEMPYRVARDMYNACFGVDGALSWLTNVYPLAR